MASSAANASSSTSNESESQWQERLSGWEHCYVTRLSVLIAIFSHLFAARHPSAELSAVLRPSRLALPFHTVLMILLGPILSDCEIAAAKVTRLVYLLGRENDASFWFCTSPIWHKTPFLFTTDFCVGRQPHSVVLRSGSPEQEDRCSILV